MNYLPQGRNSERPASAANRVVARGRAVEYVIRDGVERLDHGIPFQAEDGLRAGAAWSAISTQISTPSGARLEEVSIIVTKAVFR